ncbi:MAG: ABC transporter substrate-binding protein [bacterium]
MIRLGLLGLAIALTLGGCGGDGGERTSSRGGVHTLVIGSSNQPDRINPLVSTSAISTDMENLVFMRLVDWGPPPDLALEPRLAVSWEIADDRRSLLMHLRRDVFWTDGKPTTAEDVKFTYDRALDPAVPFPNRAAIKGIEQVEVVDPYTVRFVYGEPQWEPLLPAQDPAIMPKHLIESIPADQMMESGFGRHPVGNGPWIFREWISEERLVFDANENYCDGRPGFDRLVIRVIPEDTALRTELLTGGVHVYDRHPNKFYREDSKDPNLQFFRASDRGYVYLAWNGRNPLFEDPRVRKALTLATDRQAIIDAFRDGFGKVATCPTFAEDPAYDPSIVPFPFDPAAASALLDEAGWEQRDADGVRIRDGLRFEFTFMLIANNTISEEIATMLEQEYRKLGIATKVEFFEWTVYVGRLNAKDYESTILARRGDFIYDAESVFHSRSIDEAYNDTSFGTAVTDSLIDLAKSTADRTIRNGIWHQFFRELHALQPITPLYVSETSYPVRRDVVADAQIDIRGPYVRVHEWHPVTR